MLKAIVMPLVFAVTALVVVWPAAGAEATFKTHVQHAKAALLKKDLKRAGRELGAAGEYLGNAVASAPGAAKEGLEASAKEIRTLAEDVEKGTVTDVKRIDEASARGYRALANERFVTATEAWTRKDTKTTGRALKDAADALEDGATAVGRDASDRAKDAAKDARDVAAKLVQVARGPRKKSAEAWMHLARNLPISVSAPDQRCDVHVTVASLILKSLLGNNNVPS